MDWQAGWDGGWMKKASLGAVKVSFMIQNVITIDNHHHLIRFWSPPWPNIFIFFQALNQQSMGILIFKLLWHSITGWWGRLRWELTGTSASTLHLKRRKSIGRSNRWKEWNPESTKEWRMFQGKFAKLSLSTLGLKKGKFSFFLWEDSQWFLRTQQGVYLYQCPLLSVSVYSFMCLLSPFTPKSTIYSPNRRTHAPWYSPFLILFLLSLARCMTLPSTFGRWWWVAPSAERSVPQKKTHETKG